MPKIPKCLLTLAIIIFVNGIQTFERKRARATTPSASAGNCPAAILETIPPTYTTLHYCHSSRPLIQILEHRVVHDTETRTVKNHIENQTKHYLNTNKL